VRVDFNEDYLATTEDGLYNVGGALKILDRAATSRHIGSEPDILIIFPMAKHTLFHVGYGYLFAGEFLKQASKGSGFSCPFVQWTKDF
jgi:hypothetical protein